MTSRRRLLTTAASAVLMLRAGVARGQEGVFLTAEQAPRSLYPDATDVTERLLAEERLRNAQKLDAVGSLTAGVAHNFNNMLAVVFPALEASLRGSTSPVRELTEDALHAARRARDLVRQLMTVAGQQPPTPSTHELSPIIQRAISMCRRTFERQVQIDAGKPL